MFYSHKIASLSLAVYLAVCFSLKAGESSPIMARRVKNVLELTNEAEFIFIIPPNPSVELVAEEQATISAQGQDHTGKWMIAQYPVERYAIKGSLPDSGNVLLRMFIGPSHMSRALPTRDRSVVFLQRYLSDDGAPQDEILQLLKDDENWTTFLPIPPAAPLPAEDLAPKDKVFHFVRESLYAYTPWSALQPLRLLEACLRRPLLKEKALTILRNVPAKPDENLFYRLLAMRIEFADETVIDEICEKNIYKENPVGAQILEHAIGKLAGKQQVFHYTKQLMNTDSPEVKKGLAIALGGRFKGRNKKMAVKGLMNLVDDPTSEVSERAMVSLSYYFGLRRRPNGEIIKPSGEEQTECVKEWKSWWEENKAKYVVKELESD